MEEFNMVVTKVDQENKEVELWSPGDTDIAETLMIWRYDKEIGSLSDKTGDIYHVMLTFVRGRNERT